MFLNNMRSKYIILLLLSTAISGHQSLEKFEINRFTPYSYYLTSTPNETNVYDIYTNFLDLFLPDNQKVPDDILVQLAVNDSVKIVFETCVKTIEFIWIPNLKYGFTVPRDNCTPMYGARFVLETSSNRSVSIKLTLTNLEKTLTFAEKISLLYDFMVQWGYSLHLMQWAVWGFDGVLEFLEQEAMAYNLN